MTTSVRNIYEHKKRTRFKIKIAALMLVLGALGGGFAYLNWWKQVFEFTEVVIEGAPNRSRAELLDSEGPISFFASVHVAHPAVAGVELRKDYVRRILIVIVRERERYGVWCAVSCFWFDREGVLFAIAPRAEGALVRRVSDGTGRELRLGSLALAPERLQMVLSAFELLERTGLSAEGLFIAELEKEEAYADLLAGPRVIFSLRSDPMFAYEPLLSLKPELSKLAYIDLRVGQRIFLKYR